MRLKIIILFFIFFANSIYSQDSLSYIIIRNAPDGNGVEIDDLTMTTDDSVMLFAAGYDIDDNYIGDINANWSLRGTLDGAGGTGTSFTFSPTTARTSGKIIATFNALSDETGIITVSPGALCFIIIKTAPIDSGIEFGDSTICVNNPIAFYAAGYDCSDNYIGDLIAYWTTTGTLDSVSYTGSNFIFNPITAPDSGRIVAVFGEFSDTTGVIYVVEDPLNIHPNNLIPNQFKLETNIPNPFNNMTKIFFQLPKTTQATLTIYDIAGRKVKELISNRIYTAGRHNVIWDGRNEKNESVGTGIYLYELKTEYERAVRKMILIK